MKFITLIAITLLIQYSFSASGTFDYKQLGADWTGLCATGKEQSPIALSTSEAQCDEQFRLELVPLPGLTATMVKNTGSTLVSEYNWADFYSEDVHMNFNTFDAVQWHVHTPSEHTLNGKQYPAEVHFIFKIKPTHKQQGGRAYAVIGIFFEEAALNATQSTFFDQWKIKDTQSFSYLNMSQIAHYFSDKEFIGYEGSLTTPPCTEMVNWHVITTPEKISKADLDYLRGLFVNNGNGNNRKIMPRNDRIVKIGNRECQKYDSWHRRNIDNAIGLTFLGTFVFSVILFAVLLKVFLGKKSSASSTTQQSTIQQSQPLESTIQVKSDGNVETDRVEDTEKNEVK